MKLEEQLLKRSENKCELCESAEALTLYEVLPQSSSNEDNCLIICDKCLVQINKKEALDSKHWGCLTTSMWSEVPSVQVVSWRMLNRLSNESWAADSLDMMYLDDERLAWAKAAGGLDNDTDTVEFHKDSLGALLQTAIL
ncbi:hypothetical protein [Pedobacter sp. NJ-S-72]